MYREYLTIIKNRRLELKLSKSEMSEKLNISISMYGKYEEGESKLDIDRFIQVCEILGLDWIDFQNGSNEKKQEIISDFEKLLNRLKNL